MFVLVVLPFNFLDKVLENIHFYFSYMYSKICMPKGTVYQDIYVILTMSL